MINKTITIALVIFGLALITISTAAAAATISIGNGNKYRGRRNCCGTVADVTGNGMVDFMGDGVYLVRHARNAPGYELLH